MSLLQNSNAVTPVSGYNIDNSCRFNEPDSPYLSRTPASASNRKTWTISCWVKLTGHDNGAYFMDAGSNPNYVAVYIYQGSIAIYDPSVAPDSIYIRTTRLLRDPSAWYHIVVQLDTTQNTNTDRVKIYVNNERATEFTNTVWPAQNYDSFINNNIEHTINKSGGSEGAPYMSEYHFIDGTALTPASFGETDEDTNEWKAIEYDGSYGTNGFFLEFKSSGALGTDTSGEGNTWASTNLAATDQMIDTPQNSTGGNFCTLNSLDQNGITLSEGNLYAVGATAPWSEVRSSIGMSSGKWYWEVLYVSTAELEGWTAGIRSSFGALFQAHWYSGSWSTATNGYNYGLLDSGAKVSSGSYTASFTSALSANDIVGFALDLDSGTTTLNVYVNNVSAGTMYSSLPAGETWTPALCLIDPSGSTSIAVMNLGSDSSFAAAKTAQGNSDGNNNGDFYYTPPSGYLGLCTNNLADPLISGVDSLTNFNTVLYTGNGGSSTDAITGVGFQTDLNWIKKRSATADHYLTNSALGLSKGLMSNLTAGTDDIQRITSFDSDGFTLPSTLYSYVNTSGATYASWNWKAGGAPTATNSAGAGNVPTAGSVKINGSNSGAALAGTIPATKLSANTTAGFSIVGWTGNLTSGATVAHGLSQAPDYIIVKVVNASRNWGIGSDYLTGSTWEKYLQFTTGAELDNVNMFNDTAPSSTVFTIGNNTDINGSGDTYVAYCFHAVEGYSKAGMWVGNGNANGPFVFTGFKPAFLMLKDYTSGTGENWRIRDNKRSPYNLVNDALRPSANSAEDVDQATEGTDFLSNGFKLRNSDANDNMLNRTYLYIAFAESPFKTSRAR